MLHSYAREYGSNIKYNAGNTHLLGNRGATLSFLGVDCRRIPICRKTWFTWRHLDLWPSFDSVTQDRVTLFFNVEEGEHIVDSDTCFVEGIVQYLNRYCRSTRPGIYVLAATLRIEDASDAQDRQREMKFSTGTLYYVNAGRERTEIRVTRDITNELYERTSGQMSLPEWHTFMCDMVKNTVIT